MSINLQLPRIAELKPRIVVIGVGGAGGNAVNNMIASGLGGVDYIVANTDAQALAGSSAERRIQLGVNLTEGLGAGSKPEIGEAAAEEAIEEIRGQVTGSHMVFIAAGMGGGTGTGAAAVIARAAREAGVLTVGIVTKPFLFEGTRRQRVAEAGITELRKYVDTLIVIPNQNLFRIANERTTFAEAFVLADQVLYSGIACIVDLIVKEGLINLDFADVRTVMSGMGSAMMGTGEATGDRRAVRAAEEAIANPLLEEISLKGAKGLLLSIIGSHSMTLFEVDEAASRIRQEVDPEANIIVGATFDEALGDRIRVAIVASGISTQAQAGNAQLSRLQPVAARAPAAQAPPAPMPPQPTHLQSPHPAPGAMPATGLPDGPHAPSHHRPPVAGHSPDTADARPRMGHEAGPMPVEPSMAAPPRPVVQAPPLPGEAQRPPRETREVWRGPGEVTIEESLPLAHAPARTPGPPSPQPAAYEAARQEPFAPRAPEEVPRGARRMPEIEDFPPIGQREYRAKAAYPGAPGQANQAHGQAPPPPPAPPLASPRVYEVRGEPPQPRRTGLFQRLTGRGGSDG